jgi:hypothetical protein
MSVGFSEVGGICPEGESTAEESGDHEDDSYREQKNLVVSSNYWLKTNRKRENMNIF